jgi:hypothetical protein
VADPFSAHEDLSTALRRRSHMGDITYQGRRRLPPDAQQQCDYVRHLVTKGATAVVTTLVSSRQIDAAVAILVEASVPNVAALLVPVTYLAERDSSRCSSVLYNLHSHGLLDQVMVPPPLQGRRWMWLIIWGTLAARCRLHLPAAQPVQLVDPQQAPLPVDLWEGPDQLVAALNDQVEEWRQRHPPDQLV